MKTLSKILNIIIVSIFVSIYIVIIILLCSFSSNRRYERGIIVWKSDYKLKVEDFISSNNIEGGISANAATGIFLYQKIVTGKYRALAYFDKERSKWNTTKIQHPDWVLNHEQRHFDITEIIIRELNKELSLAPKSLTDELFQKYQYKLDSIQVLYDSQTGHSLDSIYQVYWNNKIDYLLKSD